MTHDVMKPVNRIRKTQHIALIPSQISTATEKSLEDEKDVDADFEVAKGQIYTEMREVESIFKGVIAKIFSHLVQYLKQKIAQSYIQFYIVNPLGMGIGNLLNGDLNDQYITSKLGIPDDSTPETFDLEYEEVDVPSHFGSKVNKRCWLIKSNKSYSTKAFVLMHGWFGNMQSCLHFCDALNKMGLLNSHHILVLDLHDDVGKSFESNIGLKGVTDLYDAVVYLQKELGVTDLSIYAQSVSGLSALLFEECCRKSDEEKEADKKQKPPQCPVLLGMDEEVIGNINIERIIIESPVSNIRQHILNSPSDSLRWLTEQYISTVDNNGKHFEKLSLKALLNDKEICSKVYLMQGSKDKITTPQMLHNEIAQHPLASAIKTFLFREGGHANLATTAGDEYFDTLKYVILGRSIWELLIGKGTKTLIGSPKDLTK
ncbi:hypothetical protein BgAZ_109370 [Babesia gibsoni]|uniref:Uncharacterized protein n=1 Tax=Babesia gibsoni TaxID=33632 RepID=A0AAD8UU48_BABGI|nr:hypothetical protein BgAZ_109370 [Babesia gibsoni]